jgi:hypothetical protein
MASLPVQPAPAAETIEERFRRLEATWTAETGYLSSYTAIVEHPTFQEIIGLGEAVVPLLLRDLEERPRLWVWALPDITGADPVPAAAVVEVGHQQGGRHAAVFEAFQPGPRRTAGRGGARARPRQPLPE